MIDQTTAPDETVIDGAVVEVKPDNALVVIDPTRYATELFAPFNTELATAKRSAARKTYDITTTAGMEQAKELRTTFVKIRTRAEKVKIEAKRPIDQAGKKILEIYGTLETAAKAEEKKHNDVIVAREAEIEAEAQRKRDEERARVEAIENRVALIRGFAETLAKADSGAIEAAIAKLAEKQLLPADYQEYLEDALTAFNATVDRLKVMLTEAQEREAAERQAKADADELARLKAEAAAREKKEAAERELREADEKAKADAAAKKAADDAQEIADLKAKLAAMSAPAPAPAVEAASGVEVQATIVTADQGASAIVTTVSATVNAAADDHQARTASYGYGGTYSSKPAETTPAEPTAPCALEIAHGVATLFNVTTAQALLWLINADFAGVNLAEGK